MDNSGRGVEQSVAVGPLNPKVVGSNPAPQPNLFVSMARGKRLAVETKTARDNCRPLWWQYTRRGGAAR